MKCIQLWLAVIIFMICARAFAADSGSAHDCDRLAGSSYDSSRIAEGVPFEKIDSSGAISACSKAVAEHPEKPSFHFQYGRALEAAKRYDEAAVQYRLAADKGNSLAQYNLSSMYAIGQGVEKDPAEVLSLLRKAADQGLSLAQFRLGVLYADGLSTTGLNVTRDYAEAVKWYRKAADQGFAQAQFDLGVMYVIGQGVEKDDPEAAKWYRKAAEQGISMAQNNLGAMYADGYGVAKDSAEAVKWYRKAADQGLSMAQNNLGVMYQNGLGVPKDSAEAERWYEQADRSDGEIFLRDVAAQYRAANPKPLLPEDVRKFRIQAEGAINDKDFNGAADLYAQGLKIAPWWPQGHFDRAVVLANINRYREAVTEMKCYLILVPDAPDARKVQDEIYDWERKIFKSN
jgi:TPR repeat protein